MSEASMHGEVVDERYRVGERLGAGGVGTVYRAERLKVGRTVAIKFLNRTFATDPGFRMRFEREALAMSRTYHMHCVGLIDFGVHGRRPYLVMEFVPGKPLSEVLGGRAMNARRAISITQQLLETLSHFHSRNVVHRDLKASNIMIVDAGGGADFVKLLDFGMAKLLSGIGAEIEVTAHGSVVGTPGSMSPEQIREQPIDGRSDLYSVGILLYQMLVGRKPFVHREDVEVLKMHIKQAPAPPREIAGERAISAALERVVLRALEKDRDARFQSAEEMADALAATPEGRESRQYTAMSLPAAPHSRRRGGSWAVLGWLLFLVLAGGVAVREWRRTTRSPASVATATPPDALMPRPIAQIDAAVADAAEGMSIAAAVPAAWSGPRDRALEHIAAGDYRAAMRQVRRAVRIDSRAALDPEVIRAAVGALGLPSGDVYIPYLMATFRDVPAAVDALVSAVAEGDNWYVRHHAWIAVSRLAETKRADRIGMWLADFQQATSCTSIRRSFARLSATDDERALAVVDEVRGRDATDPTVECLGKRLGR